MWIIPQLYDVSEFCGAKEKLSEEQLKQLAALLANECHWLKATELMLFFYRMKLGKYGQFYGTVDPIVITTSLRKFLADRQAAIQQEESRLRQMELEERGRRHKYLLESGQLAGFLGKYANEHKKGK